MQDPIHREYQKLADRVRRGYTLKTDVWQETRDNDEAPISADEYVEILPDLVEKATEIGLSVQQGTIENLPYPDAMFETVIDTSTIDHTPNYEKAISEYRRVLRDDGVMLLIAWNTKLPTFQEGGDLAGGQQFYFNKGEFIGAIEKHFTIGEEIILRDAVSRQVIAYICNPK